MILKIKNALYVPFLRLLASQLRPVKAKSRNCGFNPLNPVFSTQPRKKVNITIKRIQ
jgi:hypothetical protein